jgi:hypothetical protein
MEEKNIMPKMMKLVDDKCYGKTFDSMQDSCRKCWIKKSCESNFKAFVKKERMAKNPKVKKVKDKPYKKTDKYRDWC